MRVVSAHGWLALATGLVTILGALLWVLGAEAPVRVAARGILIDQGGLLEIVAPRNGNLEELRLRDGHAIAAGEVVGRLGQPELERALAVAEAALVDARLRLSRLEQFYEEQEQLEAAGRRERAQVVAQSQQLMQERRELLEDKAGSVADLVQRKVIVRDRLIDSQLEVATVKERIADLEHQQATMSLERLEQENKRALALLDERLKVNEREREVERLHTQLQEDRSIRSPYDGLVVEVKVSRGDLVRTGQGLATLAPPEGGGEPEALFYVRPEDGKRVRPGMMVEITPATVRTARFGTMLGEVVRVASLPSSVEAMRRTLRNDQLVTQLSGAGAPFEVIVRPHRDPSSPSGFVWSSSKGPDTPIGPGTLLEAKIVADRVPMADLLLPQWQRAGGPG